MLAAVLRVRKTGASAVRHNRATHWGNTAWQSAAEVVRFRPAPHRASTRRSLDAMGRSVTGPALFLREDDMSDFRFGPNVTVFLLFFGIALLDALRSGDWLRAALWLALGVVFLRADSLKRKT